MKYSIFSMQVVMPLRGADDPTYRELHKLIRTAPERTNYARMHDYYGRICNVLRREANRFELGVWDYWDDPSRAPNDFQDWVDGLEGNEARSQPAQDDGRPRHLVCTLAMLLQNGSTSDQRMSAHCDIAEEHLWSRNTFRHLLKGPALLNYLHVKSDLVYLLPGDDAECALTTEDLSGEDWHYLRPLT
ncbi:hypothetical protein F0U60_19555 [Archangium minus]|uniref:Uncharacterized protein n=1 Tax=Archangium minus TaxID=83450 RepID=A0ABY9WTC9_9BACT|nr:hypothetical protein F0U60_19555 [Archangium minus]